MKIYGQTDEIIVRDMTKDDCGKFLEMMTERGSNDDFTTSDIEVVWEFRKKKGDKQCTITSIDGDTIYGFGGIVHSELSVIILNKYSNKGFEEQAQTIIEGLR